MKLQLTSATLARALLATVLALLVIVHGRAATAVGPVTPTLPPIEATATPRPAGQLIRYSGMLLAVQDGYVFFTTGDGFKLAPGYRTIDAKTKGATTLTARTGIYASAGFDATTGQIVELALSRTPLPAQASYDQVSKFAIAQSTPAPNPDLNGAPGLTGKSVLVIFVVQVPTSTALSDDVYIATDQSNWNARAIKMDRIDALHYRAVAKFSSGTALHYRYDRGSFASSERGKTGLEEPPHAFTVREIDVMRRDDVVYHWADQSVGAPQAGPRSIPTPFNPRPFATP